MKADPARADAPADVPGWHKPNLQSFWSSLPGWVAIGFIAIGGYFLITEHAAHLAGLLPWLLIAACPLMHLFMHHGHHAGHGDAGRSGRARRTNHDA